MIDAFRRWLLPGFVFQSVVIAGGYGTGRELVEFFLSRGPVTGLAAMALATVIWSMVCALSFELARRLGARDYRTFFRGLLGRGWFLYELGYIPFLMLVLAVIAAAAGSILHDTFGLPYAMGVVGMMAAVGILVFYGNRVIERFLAVWSFVLYAVYVVFFVWSYVRFSPAIAAALEGEPQAEGVLVGGIEYAAYNLALIPAILFCTRHARDRRDAIKAGLFAGPIAMAPALLFYLTMVSQYPGILDETVPVNAVLAALGSTSFQIVFEVVLFGTLIETGTGMIHAVNERIATVYRERDSIMPAAARPAVALGLLVLGALLSTAGLVDLIARGYGTLTWYFLAVFVIPVLVLGPLKLRSSGQLERT
jgi:uncharacterized membrane protein YkvI